MWDRGMGLRWLIGVFDAANVVRDCLFLWICIIVLCWGVIVGVWGD